MLALNPFFANYLSFRESIVSASNLITKILSQFKNPTSFLREVGFFYTIDILHEKPLQLDQTYIHDYLTPTR